MSESSSASRTQVAPASYRVGRSRAGMGLFACRVFKRGECIIEYTGERITTKEADQRGGKYLFAVDARVTIDAKARHHLARYVNHSCAPNAESRISRGRVFIHALRRINIGEEITYDYGKEYFDEHIAPIGCKCNACVSLLV